MFLFHLSLKIIFIIFDRQRFSPNNLILSGVVQLNRDVQVFLFGETTSGDDIVSSKMRGNLLVRIQVFYGKFSGVIRDDFNLRRF